MSTSIQSESPGKLVRKRLFRNKPAVFGLYFIFLAVFASLFSYVLIPDNSPNANGGAVELKKLTPFSSVQTVKVKRQLVNNESFFVSFFTGFEKEYTSIPVDSVKELNGDVVIDIYRGLGKYKDTIKSANLVVAGDLDESSSTKFFLLGTDQAGRDVFSRLLLGTRISLSIGFIAVLISLFVGVLIGAVAGFFRGWVDQVLMWLTTVIWSIPGIMLVISISIALESSGVWVTFMAVGLTMWVEVARVVRGLDYVATSFHDNQI